MFTTEALIKLIIGVVYGVILGFVTVPLSKKLTLKRAEDPVKAASLDKTSIKVMYIIISVIASVAVALTTPDNIEMARNLVLLLPVGVIAIVDTLVRKIPNPMLLMMIIVQFAFLIAVSVMDHDATIFLKAILGFVIGFAACTVPSILRVPVGNGDIKYSAVIGLCIYFSGYVQSMVLMGVEAIICLFYFVVHDKISVKEAGRKMVPMGPLISLGMVITMCYPFINSIVDVESIL